MENLPLTSFPVAPAHIRFIERSEALNYPPRSAIQDYIKGRVAEVIAKEDYDVYSWLGIPCDVASLDEVACAWGDVLEMLWMEALDNGFEVIYADAADVFFTFRSHHVAACVWEQYVFHYRMRWNADLGRSARDGIECVGMVSPVAIPFDKYNSFPPDASFLRRRARDLDDPFMHDDFGSCRYLRYFKHNAWQMWAEHPRYRTYCVPPLFGGMEPVVAYLAEFKDFLRRALGHAEFLSMLGCETGDEYGRLLDESEKTIALQWEMLLNDAYEIAAFTWFEMLVLDRCNNITGLVVHLYRMRLAYDPTRTFGGFSFSSPVCHKDCVIELPIGFPPKTGIVIMSPGGIVEDFPAVPVNTSF